MMMMTDDGIDGILLFFIFNFQFNQGEQHWDKNKILQTVSTFRVTVIKVLNNTQQ